MRALRIAVADDEPVMREYYSQILPLFGHEVVCAVENGRELVEQCKLLQPDLVITDINMPVLDGLDAAVEICQDKPVPIIVVSGYHNAELTQRAREANVGCYLRKPIKQRDLQPAIDSALRTFKAG